MTVSFTKMHGCGNDYIYLDCIAHPEYQALTTQPALIERLSNRHFGIGGDGVVFILPSTLADIRMRMFNADGTEAEMCGNAARCVARYAFDNQYVKECLTLQTQAGIKQITCHLSTCSLVTVDMGEPQSIGRCKLKAGELVTVNVGNPHAVLFVQENPTAEMVQSIGNQIEAHPFFPNRTNVEFAQIISPNEINLRVWERGTGETLACGTGATATLVAAVDKQLTERNITLHLLGGDLQVEWADNQHLYLTGAAEYVYTGQIELEAS